MFSTLLTTGMMQVNRIKIGVSVVHKILSTSKVKQLNLILETKSYSSITKD